MVLHSQISDPKDDPFTMFQKMTLNNGPSCAVNKGQRGNTDNSCQYRGEKRGLNNEVINGQNYFSNLSNANIFPVAHPTVQQVILYATFIPSSIKFGVWNSQFSPQREPSFAYISYPPFDLISSCIVTLYSILS